MKIRIELAAKEAEKIAERKRISSMANASMFDAVVAERDEDAEHTSLLKFQQEQQSKKDEQMLQLQKHDFKLLLEQRQKMRDLQQLHEQESAAAPASQNGLPESAAHTMPYQLQDFRSDDAENALSSADAQSSEPDLQPTDTCQPCVLLVENRETNFQPSGTQESVLQSIQPPLQGDELSELPRDELALIRNEQELMLLNQPDADPGHQENLQLLVNESVTVVSDLLSLNLICDADENTATGSHAASERVAVLQASDAVRCDERDNALQRESFVHQYPQDVSDAHNPAEHQQARQCDDNHCDDTSSSVIAISSSPVFFPGSHSIDVLDAAVLINVADGHTAQQELLSSVRDLSAQNGGDLCRVDRQHAAQSENSQVEASPLQSSTAAAALGAKEVLEQNAPVLCTAPIRDPAFVSDSLAPPHVGEEAPLLFDNTIAALLIEELVADTAAAATLDSRHMVTDYLTVLTQLNDIASDNTIMGVLLNRESQSGADNFVGAPAALELQSVDTPFTSEFTLIDASAAHHATVEVCDIAAQAASYAPQPTQAAAADHHEREFAGVPDTLTSAPPPILDNIDDDSTLASIMLPSAAVAHAALEHDTLNSGSLARSENASQLLQEGSASTVISHIAPMEQKNGLSPGELREAIALKWEQALNGSSGSVGELKQLWRSADDGNGKLSLAELDTWFMRKYRNWYNKSVIKQAFSISKNANGFIRFNDFRSALMNIIRCLLAWADWDRANQAYDVKRTDSGGRAAKDHRLEYKEFKVYFLATFVGCNEAACKREWTLLDADGKGMVLFGEFCSWHILKASKGFNVGLVESREAGISPDNLSASASGVSNDTTSVAHSSSNILPSNDSIVFAPNHRGTVQAEAEADGVEPVQWSVQVTSEIRTSSPVLETPSSLVSVSGAESAADCPRSDTHGVGPAATEEGGDAAQLCEVSSAGTALLPERTDDDNARKVFPEMLHQPHHDDDELRLAKAEIENLKAEISRLNSVGSRGTADRDPDFMQNALSGASHSSAPSPRACILPAIRDTLLQVICAFAFSP